ncbi:MAG: lipid A biosynthesis acyltransferase, partial [Acidobacteria bacterium]|nr:lipid A biosynthesis acyltransferase [Acidobacteriota bacterium]
GEIVALQGDRPRAHSRSVPSTLFGRPTELPPGPVTLARTSGAAILPIFAFRTGRLRTRVIFRTPFRVENTGDRQADISAGIQRIAAEVEWAVRQAPYQWFCFRQLWPEDEA